MRQADFGTDFYKNRGWRGWAGFAFNLGLIAIGLFFLGPGTYAAVKDIVDGYESGSFGGAFTCQSNGL
jgi:hypothetical protein